MAGLTGRVALVTGSAQGIGRATALVLAQAGATVAIADILEDKIPTVVEEITRTGGQAAGFKLNVTEEESIKQAFKDIAARFGKPVDILVNNAGIARDQLIVRMKRSDWDLVMAINLTGPYLCTQQALPGMIKQRWGRIVNIASIFGQMGQGGQCNYSASKAGVIGLTMSIAREVASRNVTVNAVAPGFIETAMTRALPQEMRDNLVKVIPLGRVGADQDVANCVKFLASEEAGYITGHVLKVNGGILMG